MFTATAIMSLQYLNHQSVEVFWGHSGEYMLLCAQPRYTHKTHNSYCFYAFFLMRIPSLTYSSTSIFIIILFITKRFIFIYIYMFVL